MTELPGDQKGRPHRARRGKGREDFEAFAHQTADELKAQFEATRDQFEATNAKIEAKAGRNLFAAIGIGLGLGALMLLSLILVKWLFLLFAGVIVALTVLEFATALRGAGRNVPRIPTVVAALATLPAAFYLGVEGKWLMTIAGIALVVLWRLAELAFPAGRTSARELVKDLAAGTLVQVYVPFLAGFAVLLTAQDGGEWWTLAFIITVVSIDVGAYASGVAFGRHKMAPRISPGKTWEGLAGGTLAAIIAGILLSTLMLGKPWWLGLIFGATLVFTATIGDLTESLIKRDIGVKDMSSWLPGHGGLLDRLDSILPSAAAAYVLFHIFG